MFNSADVTMDSSQIARVAKTCFLRRLEQLVPVSGLDSPLLQSLLAAVEDATLRVQRSYLLAFEADILPEVTRLKLEQLNRGHSDEASDRLQKVKNKSEHSLPQHLAHGGQTSAPLMNFGYAGQEALPSYDSGSMSTNLAGQMNLLDISGGPPRGSLPMRGAMGNDGSLHYYMQQQGRGVAQGSGYNTNSQSPDRSSDPLMLLSDADVNSHGMIGLAPSYPLPPVGSMQQVLVPSCQFHSEPLSTANFNYNVYDLHSGNMGRSYGYEPSSQGLIEIGTNAPVAQFYSLPPIIQQKVWSMTQTASTVKVSDFDEKVVGKMIYLLEKYGESECLSLLDKLAVRIRNKHTAMKNGAGYLDTAFGTHLDVLMVQRSLPGVTTLQDYAKCVLSETMLKALTATIEANHWLNWRVWDRGLVSLLSKLPEDRAITKLREISSRSFRNVENITGCITTILTSMNRPQGAAS